MHTHWAAFARQPYFDEQGVFISALMSAPLLAIMLVQLVRAPESLAFMLPCRQQLNPHVGIMMQCTRPAATG